MIDHHTKYIELHGYDETVEMTVSDHRILHIRLRREGKCTIPVDELRKISAAAHRRGSKYKTRVKAYHEEHKDEINAYFRAYHEEHKDKLAEYEKAYREEHKDKANAYSKAYREEHRDELKAKQRAYRAAKKLEVKE